MKIAMIAHSIHPIQEPFAGGLEMVTHQLIKSLMALGHRVVLFGHWNSDITFDIRPIIPKMISESEDFGETDFRFHEKVGYARAMTEIANEKFDIVHNHSMHYLPILMGSFMKIPVITSIHTPPFLNLQIGALGIQNTSKMLFTMVSKSLKDSWKKFISDATVIYNGIDVSKWEFCANPTGDYMFWYGRICKEKGTHIAINAAIESGKKIVLAGPVSNRPYFDNEVQPLLISPLVEYKGHLPQNEIIPLLQNAKLMLFTSMWDEPYGLTLAESLACGTPVAAFEGGATKEILTEDCGIIVEKGSLFQLINSIDKGMRLNRENCRKRALEFCSHERMVNAYLEIYHILLSTHSDSLKILSC